MHSADGWMDGMKCQNNRNVLYLNITRVIHKEIDRYIKGFFFHRFVLDLERWFANNDDDWLD